MMVIIIIIIIIIIIMAVQFFIVNVSAQHPLGQLYRQHRNVRGNTSNNN